MPSDEPIKLMRIPINTNCAAPDCHKKINLGAYAYFIPDTNDTICIECGVERGWTSKQRATQIIQELEIREDIKALKKQRKIDADALLHLKEQIDLYRLDMRDIDLQKQAVALMTTMDDYLKNCATPAEKAMFDKAKKTILETIELQKEVKNEVQTRLYLLERIDQKRKRKALLPTPLDEDDEENIPQEEEPILQE